MSGSRPVPKTGLSEKALRDFAYRLLMEAKKEGDLAEGSTSAEISFFVEQLTPVQLADIYLMFYQTNMTAQARR